MSFFCVEQARARYIIVRFLLLVKYLKIFVEKNYVQTLTAYADLSEQEKSQDRLLVAVVTDRILENVVSGYTRKIDITPV